MERRVAERKAREEDQEARFAAAPARLKWAASILPPGMVGGAISGGMLVGKKLGVKAVPGLMAIPVVALLMVVLAFYGALRSLRRIGGADDAMQEARWAWWKRNLIPALLGLGLLITLVLLQHTEAATFLILFSMAALVLLIGINARRGFTSRNRVASACVVVLYNVLFFGGVLGFLENASLRNDRGALVVCSIVVGMGVCVMLTRVVSRPWSEVRELWLRHQEDGRYTMKALEWFILWVTHGFLRYALLLVVVVASALSLFLGVAPLLIPGSSREQLVERVESFQEPVEQRAEWEWFGRVASYLESDGGSQPDFSLAEEELRRSIESGTHLSRTVVGVAARLDLLNEDELTAQVASAFKVRPLRRYGMLYLAEATVDPDAEDSPSDPTGVRAQIIDLWPALANPGNFRLLDTWETGADLEPPATVKELLELTTIGGRTGLIERLEKGWPIPREQYGLNRMGVRVDLFDRFGRADLVDGRRDEVHEALRLPWRGIANRSERARTTVSAVELVARCGIPDDVDPEGIRAAVFPSVLDWMQDLFGSRRYEANEILDDLARVHLDSILPRGPGSLLGFVVRNRFPLSVLLLIILCIVTTARARRREMEV